MCNGMRKSSLRSNVAYFKLFRYIATDKQILPCFFAIASFINNLIGFKNHRNTFLFVFKNDQAICNQ